MVVPAFGWSAGDIAISIKLLIKIGQSLKESDGAAVQYQGAVDFLDNLKITRERLDQYGAANPDATYSEDITNHLRTVEKPWDAFSNFLKRFEKSLAVDSERSRLATAPRKMQWAVKELDGEVQKLKSAVTQPLISINTLLALQIVDSLGRLSEQLLSPNQCAQLVHAIHLAGIPVELDRQLRALRQDGDDQKAAHDEQRDELRGLRQSLSDSETKIMEAIAVQDSESARRHEENRSRQDATVTSLAKLICQTQIQFADMREILSSSEIKSLIENQQMAIMTARIALEDRIKQLERVLLDPPRTKTEKDDLSSPPPSLGIAGHCAAMLVSSIASSIATGVVVGRFAFTSSRQEPGCPAPIAMSSTRPDRPGQGENCSPSKALFPQPLEQKDKEENLQSAETDAKPSRTTDNQGQEHWVREFSTDGYFWRAVSVKKSELRTVDVERAASASSPVSGWAMDYDSYEAREYADSFEVNATDSLLPIANVSKIMRSALPEHARISREAKECMQECVSEFISFITSQAAEKPLQEKRKIVTGEDILWGMMELGFENYADILKIYLERYCESLTKRTVDGTRTPPTKSLANNANVNAVRCEAAARSDDGGLA